MVVELANLLEKVLTDVVKLLQRAEAIWLNERLDILREDVLIFIRFWDIAIKKCEEVHK